MRSKTQGSVFSNPQTAKWRESATGKRRSSVLLRLTFRQPYLARADKFVRLVARYHREAEGALHLRERQSGSGRACACVRVCVCACACA
eukprot:1212661-Pleurochrysis_carterae.AAC.3